MNREQIEKYVTSNTMGHGDPSAPGAEGGLLKFPTILADPPWSYDDQGSRMAPEYAGAGRSYRHYRTLSVEEICAQVVDSLDNGLGEGVGVACHVSHLASDHAALGLWAPHSMLFGPDDTTPSPVDRVCRAWGFEPKQIVPWIKTTKDGTRPRMGGGHYTRVVAEYLVIARRGRMRPLRRDVPGVIFAPRREHSRKPDEQYRLMEALFPGPFLELYARSSWPDWYAWGDQLDISLRHDDDD